MSSARQRNKTKGELLNLWDSLDPLPTGVLATGEPPRKRDREGSALPASLSTRAGEGVLAGVPVKKPSKASLEVARRWLDSGSSRERLERLATKIDNLKEIDRAEHPEFVKKARGGTRHG